MLHQYFLDNEKQWSQWEKNMSIKDIRVFFEKNRVMRLFFSFLRRIRVIAFVHSISSFFKKEEIQLKKKEFEQYYENHKDDFQNVIDKLCDEKSVRTYCAVIEYKIGKGNKNLRKNMCFPQYFLKDIYSLTEDAVFVDGGAYIGDTIDDFIEFTKGKYKKIYAWEPDERNIERLRKRKEKISIIDKGMWDNEDVLSFSMTADGQSKIIEGKEAKIKVSTIDKEIDEKVSLIKMDIEGAEMKALLGAKRVIRDSHPVLAICIYHSNDDLWQIPLWIKDNFPEYKLYVRAHSDTGAEIVLYAV